MGIEFFTAGWGVGFLVYLVLQFLALLHLRGARRLLIALPLPVMLGVLLWTIYVYRRDSNLWPMVMILTSPVAALAVALLWVPLGVSQRRQKKTLEAR